MKTGILAAVASVMGNYAPATSIEPEPLLKKDANVQASLINKAEAKRYRKQQKRKYDFAKCSMNDNCRSYF